MTKALDLYRDQIFKEAQIAIENLNTVARLIFRMRGLRNKSEKAVWQMLAGYGIRKSEILNYLNEAEDLLKQHESNP